MDLTTLDSVKSLIGAQDDSWLTDWDNLISSLITSVSRAVEGYCNRFFGLAEHTEYHDGGGAFVFVRCPR